MKQKYTIGLIVGSLLLGGCTGVKQWSPCGDNVTEKAKKMCDKNQK